MLSIDQCSKVIPQTAPYTITFKIGNSYQSPVVNINNWTDISSQWYFNKSNSILTWTYIDTSGDFDSSELIVYGLNMSGNNNIVCDTNGSLSSGVLTCNLTNISGTFSARGYVYRSDKILTDQYVFMVSSRYNTDPMYQVFLGFFILLICGFFFRFNEIASIVMLNVGIIFTQAIGLIAWGIPAVTAIAGISIVIIAILQR